MNSPKRIQLARKEGYQKPVDAVTICRPTMWGNPFKVRANTRAEHQRVVNEYDRWLDSDHPRARRVRANLERLRGRDLACWCKPDWPCHGDVLLRRANESQDND